MVSHPWSEYKAQRSISTDKDAVANKREKETMIQDLKCDAVKQKEKKHNTRSGMKIVQYRGKTKYMHERNMLCYARQIHLIQKPIDT